MPDVHDLRRNDGVRLMETEHRVSLTHDQFRFLALHARHLVVKWQWWFQGTLLRATTDCGYIASISAAALGAMADAGLCERFDLAGVRLTNAGRSAVAAYRAPPVLMMRHSGIVA